MSASLFKPPFGQADLSNCEREQIHLAGSIQPHGALLVMREPDRMIVQASANARRFLDLDRPVVGRPLGQISSRLERKLSPLLDRDLGELPVAVRCSLDARSRHYDGLLHRPAEGGLILELERSGPAVDLHRHVERANEFVLGSSSLEALCNEAAKIFKILTGYDRVMVYRFDDDGHGEVFAEAREPQLEPYLGNHYPASDIPQIARRLYERNRVRVLGDVNDQPVPLEPRLSPLTDRDLDMSLCALRSMSPIHVQYLKNMGVAATLVISLLVGGRLWGLIACHHYSPRLVHYEVRAVCEVLAELVATRVAALESFARAQAELQVRHLEQRLVEAVSREGNWRGALFDGSQPLLRPINARGAALLLDGQILSVGEVPGTRELREVSAWLDARAGDMPFATASLGIDDARFEPLRGVASGVLAVRVSSTPGEYLIWFRPERVHTVTWGGDPFKSFEISDDPADLSPRRSFAKWHQLVERTSQPWTQADIAAAKLIGETLSDIILQFRSVQMLINQAQHRQLKRQVESSDQPILLSDRDGRIILINEPLERLLGAGVREASHIEDLPTLFLEPDRIYRDIDKLINDHRTWHDEITATTDYENYKTIIVRADPVIGVPKEILGFVFLFSDITEQRGVEMSRRNFQKSVIDRSELLKMNLSSKEDLSYRDLISTVISNAQLAALEIADGADLNHVANMLESVHRSVARSSRVVEQLIRYKSPGT